MASEWECGMNEEIRDLLCLSHLTCVQMRELVDCWILCRGHGSRCVGMSTIVVEEVERSV